ncbi:hypothetical protein FRX31_010709 [Thalictrum thalictroides]|uniref:Uncharacterized protein n=1 Tax=Thalictrum thalictroides TaxID=46969 RepID=A0A7J6WQQ6_THATH|nr:hypothetical protein FRX31_010709 [Thalictrum thalictroides]
MDYASARTPTNTQRGGASSKKQKSNFGAVSNDTPNSSNVRNMQNINLSDDEDDDETQPPDDIETQAQAETALSIFLNIGDGPLPPERPGGRKAAKAKRKAARETSASSDCHPYVAPSMVQALLLHNL